MQTAALATCNSCDTNILTIQIGSVSCDLRSLSLVTNNGFAVPVDAAHDIFVCDKSNRKIEEEENEGMRGRQEEWRLGLYTASRLSHLSHPPRLRAQQLPLLRTLNFGPTVSSLTKNS